jgi:hypothetical protein
MVKIKKTIISKLDGFDILPPGMIMPRQQQGNVSVPFIRELTKFTYDASGRDTSLKKSIRSAGVG